MPSTYYQIDLSARALTILVGALAVVMVLAFALGYGAAWSTLRGDPEPGPGPAVSPTVAVPVTTPTAVPVPTAQATVVSPEPVPSPTPEPTPPVQPSPAPTSRPEPTAAPIAIETAYWVQVVAAGNRRVAAQTQTELERLGFPADHQQVLREVASNGRPVFKVRVGPLPDRDSASRVSQRLKAAGFKDAWIVAP